MALNDYKCQVKNCMEDIVDASIQRLEEYMEKRGGITRNKNGRFKRITGDISFEKFLYRKTEFRQIAIQKKPHEY